VDADKTDPLGELCQTTVLFFRLAALDVNGGLSHLQAMFEQLEDAVSYYEGIIVRLSAHESGIMAMAAFGLSPHAHRDDALRAVWAAMLAQAKIRHIGGQLGAGIASGQVFCGTVHNERRYEYIVMGDVVHVAAHLTQAAGASILCDTGTYLPARSQLTFEALPSLRIDNQPEPTPVYRHTP
jgi:class 3 adenylate cyclase